MYTSRAYEGSGKWKAAPQWSLNKSQRAPLDAGLEVSGGEKLEKWYLLYGKDGKYVGRTTDRETALKFFQDIKKTDGRVDIVTDRFSYAAAVEEDFT